MPEVIVRKGEPVDRALKRLKNKLDAEGILVIAAPIVLWWNKLRRGSATHLRHEVAQKPASASPSTAA